MNDKIKDAIIDDKGAVQVVEASFVFPIMFFVLIILIYMGNLFYIKAKVESVVETYAVQGANACSDPILESVKQGTFPSLSSLKTEPYRYIFGGASEVESQIGQKVVKEINGNIPSFFKNMSPKILTPQSSIADYKSYVLYSTFTVAIKYRVNFPVRLLGGESLSAVTYNSRAMAPVDDAAEFIRNTDMVIDLFSGTKLGQTISSVFGKVNEFLSNFAGK